MLYEAIFILIVVSPTVSIFVGYLYKIITPNLVDITNFINEEKAKLNPLLTKIKTSHQGSYQIVEKELSAYQANLDLDKIKKIENLRSILGIIEIIFFGSLVIVVLANSNSLSDISLMTGCIGGWIGIKVFGSYKLWGEPILGRMIFYNFLLGTLLSISSGILVGFSLSLVFKSY